RTTTTCPAAVPDITAKAFRTRGRFVGERSDLPNPALLDPLPIKFSVPIHEPPHALAHGRPGLVARGLRKLARIGKSVGHVARLQRKKLADRLSAESLFQRLD